MGPGGSWWAGVLPLGFRWVRWFYLLVLHVFGALIFGFRWVRWVRWVYLLVVSG